MFVGSGRGTRLSLRVHATASVAFASALLTVACGQTHRLGEGPRLTWSPPSLHAPKTIHISDSSPYWIPGLDAAHDYVVRLPRHPVHHGIGISGGHNVVLIGGHISIPDPSALPDPEQRVGVKLRDQTGTVHVEGLRIENASDALNLEEPRAVVQLENLWVETPRPYDTVGPFAGWHADCVQTWSGPVQLRVDRLSCHSSFQGIFLDPEDPHFEPHPRPLGADLRHVVVLSNGLGSGDDFEAIRRSDPYPIAGTELYGSNPTGHIVSRSFGPFPPVVPTAPPRGEEFGAPAGENYDTPGYLVISG